MRARRSSHRAPTRRTRGIARTGVSLLLVALVLGAGIGSAGSAVAAAPGRLEPGVVITGITGWGNSWLGAMVPPIGYEDDVAFCITAGGDIPMGTTPRAVGTIDDPLLTAAMGAHRWDNDATTRAALSFLSHMRWETGANGISAQTRKDRYRLNTPAGVQARAASLLAEAAAFAGPYSGVAATVAGAGTRVGDIHNIGVVNGSGGWTPGVPFTATLSGPARFDGSGTAEYKGVTSSSPLTLPWTATASGTVGFSITYQNVPRVTMTRLEGSGNVQTVITYGHRPAGADPTERVSPTITFDVVAQFQPTASTVVGSKVVSQGAALVDQVSVATAPGDSWLSVAGQPVPVTFFGTAYATGSTPPSTSQGAPPPGATVLGEATLTVTAPGTYPVTIPGVGTGGFVTWVWRMSVAEQPDAWRPYLRGDWRDGFGLPAETASVRHRATATSQVVARSDAEGRPLGLADHVVVSGFPEDHPAFAGGAGFTADRPTITQSLWYFPAGVEVADEHRADATLLGQVDLPAANGSYPSAGDGAFTLPVTATGAGMPGTYVFTHRFAGDDRVEPFETSVTAASEQFLLAPRPLVVTTTAVAERAPVLGDQVLAHDVAMVAGDIPAGASIAFELYQWERGAAPACTAPVWTSPALTLSGEGEVVSPSGDVTTLLGDLGFVAVVRGTDGTVLARGECGAADETIAAETFDVATSASADREAVFGDRVVVHDTASVTGTVPTSGTLTFELYTWPVGTDAVCDEPVWTSPAVPLVTGETTSPDVVVDPVRGHLGFVAVARGADGRELSRGVCGAQEETIVDDELAVVTVARAAGTVVLGRPAEVWDEATVTGHPAQGTTLTFELYTWRAGEAPSCASPIWQSPTVGLTGPGEIASPHVTVSNVAGPLGFVQVTRGADGRVLARGACGEAGETLTAVPELAETGTRAGLLAEAAGVLLVAGGAAVALSRRCVRRRA